ncbi:MAG: vanadium-dependent haloperoxidase [Nitrososphaeraceae archaeon]|nr:vanadium-dependent haloperoxidase [Nitrososphaeraceae archaeon]
MAKVHESESENAEKTSYFDSKLTRRDFLKLISFGAISVGIANVIGIEKLIPKSFSIKDDYSNQYYSENTIPRGDRKKQAFYIRHNAAKFERDISSIPNYNNGDEYLYKNKIASFSKTLPHNNLGEVDLKAYSKFIHALETKDFYSFEKIPIGGLAQSFDLRTFGAKSNHSNNISSFEYKSSNPSGSNNYLKLINPMAAFSFELIGPDSHNLFLKPPPKFDDPETAGEIGEIYWQALLREIPFTHYHNNNLVKQASQDLSSFTRFYGPKDNGIVTPETIFRGNTIGDIRGPYLSQFLLKPISYGATKIEQKYAVSLPERDYMASYQAWLAVQNGIVTETENLDPVPRYIRNGRDLAEYVHKDFPFQAYLNACLILLDSKSPFDLGNVYSHSKTQIGFSTFGAPHAMYLVSAVANLALKAAWFQKWLVHRRLRPEKFGGCIHNNFVGKTSYPICKEILDSPVLNLIFNKNSSYLLPSAYPEGCPPHPAYPAGHATMAGACITVLKAFFDENAEIDNPVIPSTDGQKLLSYQGSENLTVGEELNKLGSNIGIGRDFAGVHWRSDCIEGMNLGEELAIRFLMEQNDLFYERSTFRLTKFNGTVVEIKM